MRMIVARRRKRERNRVQSVVDDEPLKNFITATSEFGRSYDGKGKSWKDIRSVAGYKALYRRPSSFIPLSNSLISPIHPLSLSLSLSFSPIFVHFTFRSFHWPIPSLFVSWCFHFILHSVLYSVPCTRNSKNFTARLDDIRWPSCKKLECRVEQKINRLQNKDKENRRAVERCWSVYRIYAFGAQVMFA